MDEKLSRQQEPAIEIELDGNFFSPDAILKTCYWYSRDFTFEVKGKGDGQTLVSLKPKSNALPNEGLQGEFIAAATDFTLRERIEARTANIREILLAKAFSESGILEDQTDGTLVDQVEQDKQDGLFKILSNS